MVKSFPLFFCLFVCFLRKYGERKEIGVLILTFFWIRRGGFVNVWKPISRVGHKIKKKKIIFFPYDIWICGCRGKSDIWSVRRMVEWRPCKWWLQGHLSGKWSFKFGFLHLWQTFVDLCDTYRMVDSLQMNLLGYNICLPNMAHSHLKLKWKWRT